MSERRGASDLVVYVDDDENNRIVFEQTFKHRFNLRICEHPSQAIEILERGPVSVLLTDQRMPDMTGNQLLKLVHERSPETVGIVITAYDDIEPLLEAVNRGLAKRYVLKPWSAREVETIVAWGLEVYRLACEKTELEMKLLQGERFTTLGSIAGGVLHDLKQPLAVLRSNVDSAIEMADELRAALAKIGGPDGETAADLPEALRDAAVATRQMVEICEGAMRFLTAGQTEAPFGEPELAARYAITLCRPKVSSHGGVMRARVEAGLPKVALTTAGLTQVMVNLLVNAAQALVAGRRPSFVELAVERQGGGLALVVRDNGTGMSPDVLARAQEPFFTTKPAGVGTGLGLHNTHRLVTGAGGRLDLASEEGQGTTVSIWLPSANTEGGRAT